ncbi:MAG: universal stress protein, partial [Mycobacterium sp.]|nr:universal stress protein [Mycobacterium sp.]
MSSALTDPGIVVGVDGSPDSCAALRWAAQEAIMRNVGLTLVHAAAALPGPSRVVEWAGQSVAAEF